MFPLMFKWWPSTSTSPAWPHQVPVLGSETSFGLLSNWYGLDFSFRVIKSCCCPQLLIVNTGMGSVIKGIIKDEKMSMVYKHIWSPIFTEMLSIRPIYFIISILKYLVFHQSPSKCLRTTLRKWGLPITTASLQHQH